ncbi:hypothetical protein ACHAWF_014406 [Thalassiosira exigua]
MTGSDDPLRPFRESRASRRAYLARTSSLLAALRSDDDAVVLDLPNLDDGERRPASTFAIRPLSEKEREVLFDPRGCDCRLVDESTVVKVMYRVAGNGEGSAMTEWDLSSSLRRQVKGNAFGGRVLLGVLLDGPDAVDSKPNALGKLVGVSDNGLLRNCVLEPGCSVHRNAEVLDTHVMKYAAVIGCGSISCPASEVEKSRKECNFDLAEGSMDVEVGPEAGGARVLNARIESTLVDVCRELKMDSNGGTIAPSVSFEKGDGDAPGTNVLCPRSSILHTPSVKHVHLLPHSSIDAATSVSSAILLPHAAIESGCTVSHALLQWNSTITSQSDAHHVFLMERSEVGPHSFTANAVFGPDSHVSGGEVHCTLFGPNANSHHQSLLIGILWPLGRGNVGYGSNVGSNHTGRIPDQETSVGEGTLLPSKLRRPKSKRAAARRARVPGGGDRTESRRRTLFWGLGSVIKFPVDLTSSPYSIVAAGVQLPPQRVALPFSLITDGPGGMNQITPGWLLQYSPYTVARSEVKFANRRTAKRHDFYTGWRILRPGVVDLMVDARDRLVRAGGQSAGEGTGKVYKTDKAMWGLGANQLTEKGRQIGIRAYTDAIQRYALRALLDRLVRLAKDGKGPSPDDVLGRVGLRGMGGGAGGGDLSAPAPSKPAVDWTVLPWNEPSHSDPEALWEHQRATLLREAPSILGDADDGSGADALSRLLRKCVALEEDHAKRVHKSKSRDDARGAKTVPGYEEAHVLAEKDKVVLAAKGEACNVRDNVRLVEEALGGSGGARSRL